MTTTRYLIIDKLNEVYLKIEAEADIRRELGEYFTFEVPGFKFMPQYRNRVWDGKIRLFSYATGQIYCGLYPYIIDWCSKNKVEVVDGTKIGLQNIDFASIPDPELILEDEESKQNMPQVDITYFVRQLYMGIIGVGFLIVGAVLLGFNQLAAFSIIAIGLIVLLISKPKQ